MRRAVEAEEAGSDAICCSDHPAPWWAPGDPGPANSGNAWVWLGAAGQATRYVSLGTAVTGLVHRYNPVMVAQQVATLEELFPGPGFLGVGSSEAMNEVRSAGRPSTCPRSESRPPRSRGGWRRTVDARRPGEGPQGDRRLPPLGGAGRPRAGGDHPAGHGVLGRGRRRRARCRAEWKATLVDAHYTDDIHDPAEIQEGGRDVSDTKFKAMAILSSDPDAHVERLKAMRQLGATAIVIMNVSGTDPQGMLRAYGRQVLPQLRDEA